MPTLELWLWTYFDPARKRRVKTRHRLTDEDAKKQLPEDAQRVPGSLEIREVPEPGQELASTSLTSSPG